MGNARARGSYAERKANPTGIRNTTPINKRFDRQRIEVYSAAAAAVEAERKRLAAVDAAMASAQKRREAGRA
jgi:hypothetical protein